MLGRCLILAFIGSVAVVSPTHATVFQKDRPMANSELDDWEVRVLELEGVKSDLRLSSQQTAQLKDISADEYSQIRAYGNRLEALRATGATDNERVSFAQQEQMKPHERADRRRLEVLTPDQRRRLRQITFQYNGALLLAYRSPAKEMGISEKERKLIGAKLNSYFEFQDRLQGEEWEASDKTWVVHADLHRLGKKDRAEYDHLTQERQTASVERRTQILKRLYELDKKAGRKEVTTNETREQMIGRLNSLAVHNWKARMQKRQSLSSEILARLSNIQRGKWKAWTGRTFTFTTPTTLVA